MSLIGIVIVVVVVALVFEYINGFHDTANAIATVVSTKVLTARQAILFAAILNIVGALAGTHVAKTIGSGLVASEAVSQLVILCALTGAIIWNLITWYYGIPSSSSHALIGGLLGASVAHSGWDIVNLPGVTGKVLVPMIASPFFGFGGGFFIMVGLLWWVRRMSPERVNRYFRKLQLLSSGIMAFSHGSNDAQKTMGIITLSLFAAKAIPSVDVPLWVVLACALCMGAGTAAGGWRIIRTMGSKMIKLKPIHGFAAETSAAGVILTCSSLGIPLSTTHVISTSIMGVGATQRASAMKWGVVGRIVQAWVLTIPVCMFLGAASYWLASRLGFGE